MKQLLLILLVSLTINANAKTESDTATVTVQVGYGQKTATLNLVDSATGSILTGASIVSVAIQNAHPEIISLSSSYNSGVWSIKADPVGGGSGTALLSCKGTYTDPGDGLQKTESKTIVISYTVIYNPPHGTKLSLVFN